VDYSGGRSPRASPSRALPRDRKRSHKRNCRSPKTPAVPSALYPDPGLGVKSVAEILSLHFPAPFWASGGVAEAGVTFRSSDAPRPHPSQLTENGLGPLHHGRGAEDREDDQHRQQEPRRCETDHERDVAFEPLEHPLVQGKPHGFPLGSDLTDQQPDDQV